MDKSKFNRKSEWQKFGFALSIILVIIGTFLIIKHRPYGVNPIYFMGGGFVLALVSMIFPIGVKPLFILFSYVGFGVSYVVTRIILIVVFYLVITPLGLIGKLVGKRFLDTSFTREDSSYWIEKRQASTREEAVKGYENQF